jgi:predicted NBD/HSP70 family sugar kinase
MNVREALAAGVGGTHLTAAVVDGRSRIVWEKTVSSPCGGKLMEQARRAADRIAFTLEHWNDFIPHREKLLDTTAELLDEARGRAAALGLETRCAGVGVAGAVNPHSGMIQGKTGALNHPAWGEFDPAAALAARTGLVVTCLNDAKAMALGALGTLNEAALELIDRGNGPLEKPVDDVIDDFIEIDPGTGLGGAYIVGGKVWYGADPEKPDPDVGEIWRLGVDQEKPGINFEEMVSGRAIADRIMKRGRELADTRAHELIEKRGGRIQDLLAGKCAPLDGIIIEELAEAGRSIGLGIVHLAGPERERLEAPDIRTFVIGGGMVSGRSREAVRVRRTLFEGIVRCLEGAGFAPLPRIIFTTLGGKALLIGAARAAAAGEG